MIYKSNKGVVSIFWPVAKHNVRFNQLDVTVTFLKNVIRAQFPNFFNFSAIPEKVFNVVIVCTITASNRVFYTHFEQQNDSGINVV